MAARAGGTLFTDFPLIVVGASTGGPRVVNQVLANLPADLPAAVLVVQHIAAGFSSGMADWLRHASRLPVRLASEGQRIRSGEVLLAPDQFDLLITPDLTVHLSSNALLIQRPSIDISMQAAAEVFGGINEQIPKLYPLKKVDGYVPKSPLIIASTNKVSFGISASDRVSGSTNPNGIHEAVLFENENPVIGYQIDQVGYDVTRYFNAHIDYKLRSSGGPYVQLLSKLPGYANSIYRPENADGVISLGDTSSHKMKIEVRDSDGNSSIIQFDIKKDTAFTEVMKNDSSSFFQPLEFHPGFINVFERENISFYLPENCLYDSLRFRYSEVVPNTGYTIFQLHNVNVPLHAYFPVTIKASTVL